MQIACSDVERRSVIYEHHWPPLKVLKENHGELQIVVTFTTIN